MLKAVTFRLPARALGALDLKRRFTSDEDKMAAALALARRSFDMGGGPFGAAVFDSGGRLVSAGVNTVLASCASAAHAELIALCLAQVSTGSHRLGSGRPGPFTLASSAQPCSMCFGALAWSGIARLLCGARRSDVEEIAGFDEGPMPRRWIRELWLRGIEVKRDLMRAEARALLRAFRDAGRRLY